MKYSLILRVLLAVSAAAFLAVIFFTAGKSVTGRWRKSGGERYGQDKKNIGNIGESVEVVQYVGEAKDSRIQAGRMLGFKGGRQIFEDFTFTDYEEDAAKLTVTGRKASIGKGEKEATSILAEGKVDIQTSDGIRIKARYLSYRKNQDSGEKTLISRGKIEFAKDEISGTGTDLYYNLDQGLLQLHKQVKIQVIPEGKANEPPVFIFSDHMEFHREEHYLDFTGHVGIYQKDNYLKCQRIRGELTEDNKKFTRFYASGEVAVFFPAEDQTSSPEDGAERKQTLFFRGAQARRLNADQLTIDFAQDGVTFEKARLEGRVTFEMTPEDQEEEVKVLKCDRAELTFSRGRVD